MTKAKATWEGDDFVITVTPTQTGGVGWVQRRRVDDDTGVLTVVRPRSHHPSFTRWVDPRLNIQSRGCWGSSQTNIPNDNMACAMTRLWQKPTTD
jgi:hypothetical protein